ncbi:glycosyltransferase family 2 protein [Francisella salimarina]|uniref:glycosyltransferase family 2 protein n=1 Tax=Francisella salimarina TaxID=2599927 RepID=UPI003D81653B
MESKNKPIITIITVVFNGEKYLEETINSVISQTYENIEYIVIDGGSTDGTVDIIKKYDSQIDCWVSEHDEGIYDAMNKGIGLATGDWVNFMNAGDLFYNENILESIHSKLKGIFNYGHTLQFDSTGHTKEVLASDKLRKRRMPYCHQSLFVSGAYLKRNMYDLSYKIASDYNQYITAKYRGEKFNLLNICICKFRVGGISQQKKYQSQMSKEYYNSLRHYDSFSALFIFFVKKLKQYFSYYKGFKWLL